MPNVGLDESPTDLQPVFSRVEPLNLSPAEDVPTPKRRK